MGRKTTRATVRARVFRPTMPARAAATLVQAAKIAMRTGLNVPAVLRSSKRRWLVVALAEDAKVFGQCAHALRAERLHRPLECALPSSRRRPTAWTIWPSDARPANSCRRHR